MSSTSTKKRQGGQWLYLITATSIGRLCSPSVLLSPASRNHTIGHVRWENSSLMVSATSRVCDSSLRTFGSSSVGMAASKSTSGRAFQAFSYSKFPYSEMNLMLDSNNSVLSLLCPQTSPKSHAGTST